MIPSIIIQKKIIYLRQRKSDHHGELGAAAQRAQTLGVNTRDPHDLALRSPRGRARIINQKLVYSLIAEDLRMH